MPRRRRNVQRRASGCKVCGDPSVGRGIAKHLEGAHEGLTLTDYNKCFKEGGKIVTDKLVVTGTTANGTKNVVIHVLIRRFTIPRD